MNEVLFAFAVVLTVVAVLEGLFIYLTLKAYKHKSISEELLTGVIEERFNEQERKNSNTGVII